MKKLLLLSLIISSTLMAKTITLDEALSKALDENLDLKTKEYRLEIQSESASSVKKDLLPKLSAETMLETSEGKNNETSESEILFKGPLYRGGEILNSIETEKKLYKSTEIDRSITEKETIFEVKSSYYEGLKAMSERDFILESLKFYEGSYEKNEELHKLNLITRADLLAVKSELSNRRLDLIKAENSIEKAVINLKRIIGMKSEEEIHLEAVSVNNESYTKDPLKRSLVEENLEVKSSEVGLELAVINKDNATAAFKPKIDYHFGINEVQSDINKTYDEFQGVAGVTFSLDIFSWGQRIDEMDIADLEIDLQKNIIEDTIQKQNERYDLLSNDLESLNEGIKQSKEAIENYEEKFKFYGESYSYNLISINDYLDSEQDLLDEKVRLNDLVYDYEIKKEEILTLVK